MEGLPASLSSKNPPEHALEALNEWLHGGTSSPLGSSADNSKIYGGTTKLYGRSKEQEQIRRVYQRITTSTTSTNNTVVQQQSATAERRTEFIVIEGETGSGKTALAENALDAALLLRPSDRSKTYNNNNNSNHIHQQQQVDDDGGYCVLGKFDQLVQLQKPHSAFVEALTMYAEAVVERGQVERVRQLVRQSTEKDAIPVMVKMVPALAKILLCNDDDDDNDNPALKRQQQQQAQESDNRCDTSRDKEWTSSSLSSDTAAAFEGRAGFTSTSSEASSTHCKDALRIFLRAITSPETPLVLVLDDCHWMDEAALDMLQSLLTDTVNQGILFIATCRSDDAEISTTSGNHQRIFTSMVNQLSPQEVNVTRIHLTAVGEADTRAMLADLFQRDAPKVTSLAQFVSSQTHGNAFFIIECLRALMEGGYVRYNKTSNAWSWDIEEVRVDFGGTLSEVVRRKISQLPKETLDALKYASCLGTKIDKEILGYLIMRDSPSVTIEFCLETAAARGLLNRNAGPSMNISWSFSHDSIREVTYSIIPEDFRAEFHYRIGRRLYRAFAMKEADDRIFVIVSQLIVGSSFIKDENERIGVANLCYHAGARAVRMLSFESAYKYLKHGVDLLGSTCWRDEYDLCLSLYSALAEVACCTQRFEEVLLLVKDVSNLARSKYDMLRVTTSVVRALGSSGRVNEAVEYAFELLRGLGEYFPKHSNHLKLYFQIQQLRRRLRKRTNESLLRIPDMTDQSKSDAMSIMNLLFMYLYLHDPKQTPTIALRMVSVSLDYGLCAASSLGFTFLGGILCGPLNHIEEGGRIAKAGLQMYERFGFPVWLPRVASAYYAFVHFWIGTFESSLDTLKTAYEIGMTHGDIEFAFVAAMTHTFVQYEMRPLLETLSAYERLRERMVFYNQKTVWNVTRPFCQCIHNLLGRSGSGGPTVLDGEILDNATVRHFQEHNTMLFLFANVHLMVLNYLFGDVKQAAECAKVIRPLTNHPPGGMDCAMLVFYDGLIAARKAQMKLEAWRSRRRAENQLKRLSHWAKYAPHTFLCRAFLVEAELRVACGDHTSAHSKYVAAIALAKDSGFLNIVALSNELAAKYFLQRSEEKIAEGFLREALEYYERWGATAKSEHLRLEFKMGE